MSIPHNSWASIYDEVYERTFGSFIDDLTSRNLDIISEYAPANCEILDVGAGTGRLSIPLSEKGYSVTALDPSDKMLQVLNSKDPKGKVHTVTSSIQNLDLQNTFPFIVCVFSVFCYLTTEQELKKAVASIAKHLAPEGRVLIDVTALGSFRGMNYDDPDLKRIITITDEDPQNDVFRYHEAIKIFSNGIQTKYTDEFLIKYWHHQSILDEFAIYGVALETDLTTKMLGSGAMYYLLQR